MATLALRDNAAQSGRTGASRPVLLSESTAPHLAAPPASWLRPLTGRFEDVVLLTLVVYSVPAGIMLIVLPFALLIRLVVEITSRL
jgi:hypothetical protein